MMNQMKNKNPSNATILPHGRELNDDIPMKYEMSQEQIPTFNDKSTDKSDFHTKKYSI